MLARATKIYPIMRRWANTGITDEITPVAGINQMYTIGWPKIQNRCCQSSGAPPELASKKWNPHFRSSCRRRMAAVSDGNEKITMKAVAISLHMNSDNRLIESPGQRNLKMVTIKLTAETVVETVRN